MSNRLEYNRKIIEKLSEFIEEHPDQNFFRILYNLNIIRGFRRHDKSLEIIDDYNKESESIYKNMDLYQKEDYI